MKKRLLPYGLLGVAFILTSLLYGFGMLDTWQEKLTDRFFIKTAPKQNIVVIAVDDISLHAIGNWPFPRKTFASILPDLKEAKIIGFDINFADPSSFGSADDLSLVQAIKESKVPVVLPLELRTDGVISVAPLELFAKATSHGFVNIPIDQDGVARKASPKSNDLSSLPYILAGNSLTSPEIIRIKYSGPAKTFTTISFADIANHLVPSRIFKDAIVMVGVTANDLHDIQQTPFGLMSGVELNANIVETLLNGSFFKELPFALVLLIILAIELLAAWLILHVKRLAFLILSLVILFIVIIALSLMLFHFSVIFPVLYELVGLVLATALMVTYSYAMEGKEKRFIRSTFQYYLASDIIEQLVTNPEKLKLGGEKRMMTILFSDVRDFTTISESMTPENLTSFMSEYFTRVSDIVMDGHGVIDKYIGDAIMAFWGAPLDNPDHPKNACEVALAIMKSLEEHNVELKEKGLPAIATGFGINTGEVIVGNMGSKKRFNYTIVGDDVNFTSRLEGLTKEYGVGCIISESTRDAIKDIPEMYVRGLDEVLVKGKKKPKKIFELRTPPKNDTEKKSLDHFEAGRKLYVEGKWSEAIAEFETALTFQKDKTSVIFIERCKTLIANPPSDWTGVHKFTTK